MRSPRPAGATASGDGLRGGPSDHADPLQPRHAPVRSPDGPAIPRRDRRGPRRAVRDPDGAPVLGYVVGAAAWIIQRVAGAADRAPACVASRTSRRQVGLGLACSWARAWLVGLTILAVGLAGAREDGLMAAVLVLVAYTVYLATSLLSARWRGTPPAHETRSEDPPRPSLGVYVLALIVVVLDLRLRRAATTTSSSPRTSSSSTPGSTSPGRSTSTRPCSTWSSPALLTVVHDALRRAPHAAAPEPRADRRRGRSTRLMRDNITRGEHGRQDGGEVVPVHRDAVPVHLVLEPDRLHPAADQHAARRSTSSASQVPSFAIYAATANLSIPLALALIVFIVLQRRGHPRQGRRRLPRRA